MCNKFELSPSSHKRESVENHNSSKHIILKMMGLFKKNHLIKNCGITLKEVIVRLEVDKAFFHIHTHKQTQSPVFLNFPNV